LATRVGTHCILDLYQCPPGLLNDLAFVRQAIGDAAERGVSTLLKLVANQFEPQGVTVLGLLAESHISAHSWPERGHMAVDIFACGDQADPEEACRYLIEQFQAEDHTLRIVPRGEALGEPETENGTDHASPREERVCQARS
jgi:S-adenosylmethionine decarboxylase